MNNDGLVKAFAKAERISWTNQQPSQIGYYWYRSSSRHRASIVYITRLNSGQFAVMDIGDTGVEYLDGYRGEWCGPLTAPGEE